MILKGITRQDLRNGIAICFCIDMRSPWSKNVEIFINDVATWYMIAEYFTHE